ncbi:MAG: nucleotide exchange factor GrpE [Tannerellaceae bacterium]|jgi:molecular chaperone GrpE|nr:nucleotide exchange factor GrpE [Tannerellaceae bacterium]
MNPNKEMELNGKDEPLNKEDATNLQEATENMSDMGTQADNVTDEKEDLQKKYEELNDSHLRLMAEFDNYRKRTLREKAELIKSGGESALSGLLPVIDDLERAVQTIRTAEDLEAVKEGIELIYNKFISYLGQQGVKPIPALGEPFDTEKFEAIAIIPAPDEDKKGKVVDSVQTGYTLYDKVIRHAKVVVGE